MKIETVLWSLKWIRSNNLFCFLQEDAGCVVSCFKSFPNISVAIVAEADDGIYIQALRKEIAKKCLELLKVLGS